MKKPILILIFALFTLSGCKKEDQNPHLKDPIYQDIQTKEQAAATEVVAAEKALEEVRTELKAAKPQTGEIKRAQKKVFDAERKLQVLKQNHASLIIRKQTRIQEAKTSYRKAFAAEKDWPDPNEYESYLAAERLRQTKSQWDVPARIEQTK